MRNQLRDRQVPQFLTEFADETHPALTVQVSLRSYSHHQCQGLAGPWYARRERETVKAKV